MSDTSMRARARTRRRRHHRRCELPWVCWALTCVADIDLRESTAQQARDRIPQPHARLHARSRDGELGGVASKGVGHRRLVGQPVDRHDQCREAAGADQHGERWAEDYHPAGEHRQRRCGEHDRLAADRIGELAKRVGQKHLQQCGRRAEAA